MIPKHVTRRDFHRLIAAAAGGIIAGATMGCGEKARTKTEVEVKTAGGGTEKVKVNACRGLNACKNMGKGDHECAGRGQCATADSHACGGLNACKHLGGCQVEKKEQAAANNCKGEGNCSVPITKPEIWEAARKNFERQMKAAGKKFGSAPPPAS